jgi:hypothetical protein
VGESERENSFRRDYQVFVAGKGASRRACAATSQATDEGTFPAARQAPNERTEARAAADEFSRTLSFALLDPLDAACGDGIGAPSRTNPVEAYCQNCLPFESTEAFCLGDGASGGSARGNDGLTVDDDIRINRGRETVASLIHLGAQSLSNPDAYASTRRNNERRRSRSGSRCGRRLCRTLCRRLGRRCGCLWLGLIGRRWRRGRCGLGWLARSSRRAGLLAWSALATADQQQTGQGDGPKRG